MQTKTKTLIASTALSLLLGLSSCGKSKSSLVSSLPQSASSNAPARVDYEKLVEGNWQDYAKLQDLKRQINEDDKDILFWGPKNFQNAAFGLGDQDAFQGHFFQKTVFPGQVEQSNILNPNDGNPGIFIVPKFKTLSQNGSEKTGFYASIFVDKDYIDKIQDPKLYFVNPYKEISLDRKLDFKREGDLYLATVDLSNGDVFRAPFITSSMGGLDSFDPIFVIGNLEDTPSKFEPSKIKSPLYTLFGIYQPQLRREGMMKAIQDSNSFNSDQKKLEQIISECFNYQTQAKLSVMYEQMKAENPNYVLVSVPEDHDNCGYAGLRGTNNISLGGGKGMFRIYLKDKFLDPLGRVMITVNKSSAENKWDVEKLEKY